MTEEQWWKELEGKPPDDDTWSIFADWLEDNGEDGKAEGARTVFTRKLKPKEEKSWRFGPPTKSFDWWELEYHHTIPIPDEQIPEQVFKHLTGWKFLDGVIEDQPWREYRTPLEAYQDLLNAYTKLHKGKP